MTRRGSFPAKWFVVLTGLLVGFGTHAALTELSSVPLNTYYAPTTTDVKPNIMFIFDDSGSMGWRHMPDNSADAGSSVPFTYGYYGHRSSQCNGVYYNPAVTYAPPVYADGSSYPNATFTAAWDDGFNTADGTTNLSSSFRAEGDSSNQAAYYFKYTGTQTTPAQKNYYVAGNTFVNECSSASGANPGQNVFTKVTVSSSSGPNSTDERTNFANWYSYYRTRINMMKTATGRAFSSVTDRFRVGFMTINSGGTDFLNIADFNSTQKGNWYSALYSASPGTYTPLRAALSNAGRMYAGKIATINGESVTDPVQYSCQQNYTILSTDGFWNSTAGTNLDGGTIGNEDAGLGRPYADGAATSITQRTSNLQERTLTLQAQSRTSTLQARTLSSVPAPSIQRRDSTNSGSSYGPWYDVASCTVDNSGPVRNQCRRPVSNSTDSGATWSPWAYETNCTPDNSGSSREKCSGSVDTWSSWANASSCTASATIQCQYTAWSGWGNVASCAPLPKSTAPNYTVGTAVECQDVATSTGAWVDATSCTTSSTKQCQYTSWSGWTTTTSCTPVAQSSGSPYAVSIARECLTTTSGGSSATLSDVAAYYYNTDLRTSARSNCSGASAVIDLCNNDVPAVGRDVASHQHMTTYTIGLGVRGRMVYNPNSVTNYDYWQETSTQDFGAIRDGTTASGSVCSWQSGGTCTWPIAGMSGSDGKIENVDDLWHTAVNGHGTYFSATDPDSLSSGLASLLQIIVRSPRPGTAAAAASSNPNISSADNYVFSSSYRSVDWFGELIRQTIDNSGTLSGQQWSAQAALDCAIGGMPAWAALKEYYIGDIFLAGSECRQVIPTGSASSYTSPATYDLGGVDSDNTKLVTSVTSTGHAGRTLYTNIGGTRTAFLWANLAAAQSYFSAPYLTYTSATAGLSQFCSTGATCLSSAAQSNTTATADPATNGAAGENLVNFLRGERANESGFYRTRKHVLGDFVASEARYVKAPMYNYADTGYSSFKSSKAGRTGMIYVGGNDGMLHAFYAEDGREAWAYIPSYVLPNLYKLADKNYESQHQYYADGSPEVGDIYAGSWKTILVAGLNLGGKGYYALDVTDPADPKLLWEFTDSDMGYTYGNPRITKLSDGTWVVIVSSGYNNADGKGHLYVLNANTGTLIREITTSAGSAASPSGLARIAAHVPTPQTNNTVKAVYGGDLLGNLWRFDVNGNIGAAGYDAQLLINFTDASGNAQPITAKPTVATIDGNTAIFVGTGIFLGIGDIATTTKQSFYAIKDNMGSTTYGDPRTVSNNFIEQTMSQTTCPAGTPASVCTSGQTVRTITGTDCSVMNWSTNNGWYVDLLTDGERSTTDSTLALGSLVFTTNIPNKASATICSQPGQDSSASFAYNLNYKTGCSVTGTGGVAGVSLGNGLVTRPNLVKLPDGRVVALIRVSTGQFLPGTTDDGDTKVIDIATEPTPSSVRRVSWRELVTE